MRTAPILFIIFFGLSTSGCTTNKPDKLQYAQFNSSTSKISDGPKATQQHKRDLLKAIRDHINANELTLPADNNALCKIQEFESLYPNDSSTAALRNEISDRYLTIALRQLDKPNPSAKDFTHSFDLIDRAKKIDARLGKMEQLLTKLHRPSQKKPQKDKQRKVIRTPLNAEAVAARTSIVRNVAKVISEQAIEKKGSIVIYGATESDTTWISGVIRSFYLEVDQDFLPTIRTDSSKAWKPTIDIVYLD